jgi:hypothetical protein
MLLRLRPASAPRPSPAPLACAGVSGASRGVRGGVSTEVRLDAEHIDVYKGAHCLVVLFDPRKPATWAAAQETVRAAPDALPVLLLSSFRDVQASDGRGVAWKEVEKFARKAGAARAQSGDANRVRCLEASMSDCFGLKVLYNYFNLPYLELKAAVLEEQAARARADLVTMGHEVETYSAAQDYDAFCKWTAETKAKRAGGAAEPTVMSPGAAAVPIRAAADGRRERASTAGAGGKVLAPSSSVQEEYEDEDAGGKKGKKGSKTSSKGSKGGNLPPPKSVDEVAFTTGAGGKKALSAFLGDSDEDDDDRASKASRAKVLALASRDDDSEEERPAPKAAAVAAKPVPAKAAPAPAPAPAPKAAPKPAASAAALDDFSPSGGAAAGPKGVPSSFLDDDDDDDGAPSFARSTAAVEEEEVVRAPAPAPAPAPAKAGMSPAVLAMLAQAAAAAAEAEANGGGGGEEEEGGFSLNSGGGKKAKKEKKEKKEGKKGSRKGREGEEEDG